ncbi:hypothetical protein RRG08_030761 [Elysia crispata]|uniref:Uncharacterized protein n=1 Tax=Elysia crispata TaxID=231223 RepID=A0AAE0YF24_9GAST|nr:hypothetical protein RRG08_030761 [Elysia crispata]
MPALHTTHHLQAVLCNQIPHLAETLEVPLAAQTHGPAPYRTTAIEKQQGVMLRSHFLAESSKYMRLFTGRDFTKVTVRTTSSNTRTRCAGKVQTLVWFPTYVLLFPVHLYKPFLSVWTVQKTEELSEDSVFKNGVGEWSNDMAAGMMPLDQEEAAFGDVVREIPGNNGNNHRH